MRILLIIFFSAIAFNAINSQAKANSQWEALLDQHKQELPCEEQITAHCLFRPAFDLAGVNDNSIELIYINHIADLIIKHSDEEAARSLLKIWPTDEYIHDYYQELSKKENISERTLKYRIDLFKFNKVPLLIVAKEFDGASELLEIVQAEKGPWIDLRSVQTLVMSGEIEQAYIQAKRNYMNISQPKDGKPISKDNYNNNQHAILIGIGMIAEAYIEQGEFDKAYQAIELIEKYWTDDAYVIPEEHRVTNAIGQYRERMLSLVQAYAENGEDDLAHKHYKKLTYVLMQVTKPVGYQNTYGYSQAAMVGAKNHYYDDILELAEFVKDHNQLGFKKIYRSKAYDLTSYLYALAGKPEVAISYINSEEFSAQAKANARFIRSRTQRTPLNEIKLTTYLRIAEDFAKIQRKDDALYFLERARPLLSTRVNNNPKALLNLEDYLQQAQILFILNELDDSRTAVNYIWEQMKSSDKANINNTIPRDSFLVKLAKLHVQLLDAHDLLEKWNKTPYQFPQSQQMAHVGQLLLQQERFEEFDNIFHIIHNAAIHEITIVYNWKDWNDLYLSMIKLGKYDQINMIVNDLDQAKRKLPEHLKSEKIHYEGKNGRQQQLLLLMLMMESESESHKLSNDDKKKIWSDLLDTCDYTKSSFDTYSVVSKLSGGYDVDKTAEDYMAGCYLTFIEHLAILNN